MKKIALLLSLILCAFFSFAQFPNTGGTSNDKTIFTIPVNRAGIAFLAPVVDTLNNPATPYRGALTVRPQDSLLYMSDGVRWVPFISNNNAFIVDSIYVEQPLAVKIGTSGVTAGKQIIYFLKESGLIAGGIPISTGCRTLVMPPSIYNINFNQYSSPATDITIDTSSATLNRTDRIVGDTNGNIIVLKGVPSSLGLPQPFNPSSQFSLALISIPAGATCTPPAMKTKVLYDQNLGVGGGEFDVTTDGAISADGDNTDNPLHLTKALFISTYTDSSQVIFTDTGNRDTVTASSSLVLPNYLNVRLTNPIQGQFFLNDTAVSDNINLNSFINALDTGQYQTSVIPFSAFNFHSQIFNKFVLNFRGWDTAGAGGLYLDWVRIQQGITSTFQNNYVDSISSVNVPNRITYYKGGIAYDGGAISGGGSITASNGLTLNGSDVQLGGTLTGQTDIISGSNELTISGSENTLIVESSGTNRAAVAATNSSTGVALSGITTDGTGLVANSTNGIGAQLSSSNERGLAVSSDAYTGASIRSYGGTYSLDAITSISGASSSVLPNIKIQSTTSGGVASNGFGGKIDFYGSTNTTNVIHPLGSLVYKWTDAVVASRTSQFQMSGYNNATEHFLTFPSLSADRYSPISVNGNYADATGNITISTGGGNQVTGQEFTGSTSTTLTLSQTYTSGTIKLYKNGVRLLAADFTEATGTTITLNVARLSGDVFQADFNY